MSFLTELQERVGRSNTERGFREYLATHTLDDETALREQGNSLMLIVSEAAEALEELRNGNAANEVYHPEGYNAEDSMGNPNGPWVNAGKPEGVPSEIADIVIRCLDFADANGFDLGDIVLEKMEYNESRPYKHGKKF